MLEIRNIVKVCKSQKSERVKLLDDIKIKFQERGLVFVLNDKKESSTALFNILAGLEKPY